MNDTFSNKKVLITGGTGSLGKVLVRRLLSNTVGHPDRIIIFSRDEAKQYFMRMEFETLKNSTEEIIYQNYKRTVQFRIGDVRDYHSVASALKGVDIVINAAALKQVPNCEYSPWEAVRTNIEGAQNIVQALREFSYPVKIVVGVSTDKAVNPVNVMGMTKAIQERVFISANLSTDTKFVCVRYGNVLASRGSVIPLFHEQIKKGGPVTVTTEDMTRFLLPLEKGVDTIIEAIDNSHLRGCIFIPIVKTARIMDVAKVMTEGKDVEIKITGIRPGEKIHEVLVSAEEAYHTNKQGNYYVISSMLPELQRSLMGEPLVGEYSSKNNLMTLEETKELLEKNNLLEGVYHE